MLYVEFLLGKIETTGDAHKNQGSSMCYPGGFDLFSDGFPLDSRSRVLESMA